MRKTLVALGTGAAAGALLLGACTSSPTAAPAPSQKGIEAVYANTLAARTAAMSLDVSVSGAGLGRQDVSITGTGLIDMVNREAQFTAQVPGTGGSIEERVVGGVLYVRIPGAQSALGGKTWASVDISQYLASQGGGLGSLTGSTTDPSQILSLLQGVSDSVTTVGTTQVGGVAVTEYRATLDLTKLAASNPQLAGSLRQLSSQIHLSSIPIEIFVDSEGHLRRMVMDLSFDPSALPGAPSSGAAGPVDVKMTVNLSNFGTPVQVSAPPAADVAPLPPSLLANGGLSGSLGGGV